MQSRYGWDVLAGSMLNNDPCLLYSAITLGNVLQKNEHRRGVQIRRHERWYNERK
jgi:hypothetical protein